MQSREPRVIRTNRKKSYHHPHSFLYVGMVPFYEASRHVTFRHHLSATGKGEGDMDGSSGSTHRRPPILISMAMIKTQAGISLVVAEMV